MRPLTFLGLLPQFLIQYISFSDAHGPPDNISMQTVISVISEYHGSYPLRSAFQLMFSFAAIEWFTSADKLVSLFTESG